MSNIKQFLKAIEKQIMELNPNSEIGKQIEDYLKLAEKRIASYKKWATWIGLLVTIVVNVLQALGIW